MFTHSVVGCNTSVDRRLMGGEEKKVVLKSLSTDSESREIHANKLDALG